MMGGTWVGTCWRLWWCGVWESLQLHRCVVLFALDDTNQLWPMVLRCLLLNGCVFLGSLAWWLLALQPAVHWLLAAHVAPAAGATTAAALEAALHAAFHVCWLAPAYLVTFLASAAWYNDVAAIACQVLQKRGPAQQQQQQQQQAGAAAAAGNLGRGAAGAPGASTLAPAPRPAGFEAAAAQELFRTVLFVVFYSEIWAMAKLPYVGRPLYFVYSCWLCAYYCFDYAWALRGVSLADRIAFFEGNAAFFAGYGLAMAAVTMLLPFYLSTAVVALMYPPMVLVACHSDPARVVAGVLPPGAAPARRTPIFVLALRPTQWLLRAVPRLVGSKPTQTRK